MWWLPKESKLHSKPMQKWLRTEDLFHCSKQLSKSHLRMHNFVREFFFRFDYIVLKVQFLSFRNYVHHYEWELNDRLNRTTIYHHCETVLATNVLAIFADASCEGKRLNKMGKGSIPPLQTHVQRNRQVVVLAVLIFWQTHRPQYLEDNKMFKVS